VSDPEDDETRLSKTRPCCAGLVAPTISLEVKHRLGFASSEALRERYDELARC
jgi:hypothetical protein